MIDRFKKLSRNLPRYLRAFGVKGLLCFARIRLSSSTQPVRMYFRGSRDPVWLRPASTDVSTMKEIFLERDYEFEIGAPVQVIVDAGANIGLASVFFARKYPLARIIAIEPEAGNFALLQRNTQCYPRVTPLKAALWGSTGEIAVLDPGRGAHGFITMASGDAVERVPAISIPDLLATHGIDRIDLLKIDIEGAEKEVFESSAGWIDRISVVVAELHERFKPGCNAAFTQATRVMPTTAERGKLVMKAR